MPEEKQMTLYVKDHAESLVSQYDEEFEAYKISLNLSQKDRSRVSQRSFAFTKVLIGSFLAVSAVSLILGSNYLAHRGDIINYSSDDRADSPSWVFPVYFMAGVFSVSSVLSFKNAIR